MDDYPLSSYEVHKTFQPMMISEIKQIDLFLIAHNIIQQRNEYRHDTLNKVAMSHSKKKSALKRHDN